MLVVAIVSVDRDEVFADPALDTPAPPLGPAPMEPPVRLDADNGVELALADVVVVTAAPLPLTATPGDLLLDADLTLRRLGVPAAADVGVVWDLPDDDSTPTIGVVMSS